MVFIIFDILMEKVEYMIIKENFYKICYELIFFCVFLNGWRGRDGEYLYFYYIIL